MKKYFAMGKKRQEGRSDESCIYLLDFCFLSVNLKRIHSSNEENAEGFSSIFIPPLVPLRTRLELIGIEAPVKHLAVLLFWLDS